MSIDTKKLQALLQWYKQSIGENLVTALIVNREGLVIDALSKNAEESVDEERRLFYVAMTRSKDMLYVYFPLRYYRRGWGMSNQHAYAKLTRFITKPVRALFEERTGQAAPESAFPRYTHSGRDVRDQLKKLWRS